MTEFDKDVYSFVELGW